MEIAGGVVVFTGASSGIGRATALLVARRRQRATLALLATSAVAGPAAIRRTALP